eukprot:TRINITY_DN13697_c0_g1_i1.p1 TRINITY_DN13697_c0_g1~~TRINITY_DN13697_c0_g1_i1.p1  ORF type:complete len:277 (-),score=72.07 TRINITY_DN13697_c0_g1_i1:25-783(-)
MARARRFRKPKSSKKKGGITTEEAQQQQEEGEQSKKRKNEGTRSCSACGTTSSPEWRRGPQGSNTFCNACGLHYAKLLKKQNIDSPPALEGGSHTTTTTTTGSNFPTEHSPRTTQTKASSPTFPEFSPAIVQRMYPTTYTTYTQNPTQPVLTPSNSTQERRQSREINIPETPSFTTPSFTPPPPPYYLHHQYANMYQQQTQQTFSADNIPLIQIQEHPFLADTLHPQTHRQQTPSPPEKKKGAMALDSLLNP